MKLVTSSPEETEALGARLAACLRPGDVVLLWGELGAGKTTFVRGACRALGVTRPVTSPTYMIGHRYEGRVVVSHIDLYRFETVSDADWAELGPYFENAIVFVEWPDGGAGLLPDARVSVRFAHMSPEQREITLDSGEPGLLAGLI